MNVTTVLSVLWILSLIALIVGLVRSSEANAALRTERDEARRQLATVNSRIAMQGNDDAEVTRAFAEQKTKLEAAKYRYRAYRAFLKALFPQPPESDRLAEILELIVAEAKKPPAERNGQFVAGCIDDFIISQMKLDLDFDGPSEGDSPTPP